MWTHDRNCRKLLRRFSEAWVGLAGKAIKALDLWPVGRGTHVENPLLASVYFLAIPELGVFQEFGTVWRPLDSSFPFSPQFRWMDLFWSPLAFALQAPGLPLQPADFGLGQEVQTYSGPNAVFHCDPTASACAWHAEESGFLGSDVFIYITQTLLDDAVLAVSFLQW